MAFAKIFGPDDDQILITLDTDTNGDPHVRISFIPEGYGLCSGGPSWKYNEGGWNKAEIFFEKINEELARSFVDKIKSSILDNTEEE